MTSHHCPNCDALLPTWPAPGYRSEPETDPPAAQSSQSAQLDRLIALGEIGYEFTTREFYEVCGFRTPNMMAKALKADPRFTPKKSGVIRWALA